MNESEFSPQAEPNDQDVLDQIADLMTQLDSQQAEMEANVMDQANAVVEGNINSAEVANILEDKLFVLFENVFKRLREIIAEREAARAEVRQAIDLGDEAAANTITTKPNEDERQEARRITQNISNYMNRRAELPAPEREHSIRVLLQDIQEFFEMRKGK